MHDIYTVYSVLTIIIG